MLLGAAAALLPCGVLALLLRRRLGWVGALATAGLVWSVLVIAVVTLVPAQGAPGIVPAEDRLATCGEIGGPSPEGFWIFEGGQRLLNTLLFVPAGALVVVVAMIRPRWSPPLVLLGLGLLGVYSAAIELVQLEVARLDRACDLTDVVDNVSGALLGAALGLVLVLVLQPWRGRRRS
jgi:uncharacterized membrane protein